MYYKELIRFIKPSTIIAFDFDGTLTRNDQFPEIGEANTEVIAFAKLCQTKGARIILWTCREGEVLEKAVQWCKERGLIFDAVNENLKEEVEKWGSDCRKVGADYFIDDKNVSISERTYLLLETLTADKSSCANSVVNVNEFSCFEEAQKAMLLAIVKNTEKMYEDHYPEDRVWACDSDENGYIDEDLGFYVSNTEAEIYPLVTFEQPYSCMHWKIV